MPGLSDYSAENLLNWETGGVAFPALPAVYLGLFTAPPTSDAGTGGTEVTGGSYARVQVGGSVATNGATASGNNVLHFASVPAWIVAGMTVRDATTPAAIPAATTIVSTTATTVTLSANAAGGGVSNGDTITFSAFGAATGSTGTAPGISPANALTTAAVTFPFATASWGTVVAFGLFDALGPGGNLLAWDYLGVFPWLPATVTAASPGVISAHAHGFAANDNVAVTAKFGGTIPTFSQSNLTGILAVVSPTTDTFTVTNGGTAVNTSSTGDFSVRKIAPQQIVSGIIASFAAGQLTLYAA